MALSNSRKQLWWYVHYTCCGRNANTHSWRDTCNIPSAAEEPLHDAHNLIWSAGNASAYSWRDTLNIPSAAESHSMPHIIWSAVQEMQTRTHDTIQSTFRQMRSRSMTHIIWCAVEEMRTHTHDAIHSTLSQLRSRSMTHIVWCGVEEILLISHSLPHLPLQIAYTCES
jgi:hypothetical protein